MKNKKFSKALAILLAFALAVCMTACGETSSQNEADSADDVITSIEIGGDFGAYELEGKAFGDEYTKVDIPEWYEVVDGSTDTMYYCEDCDTPYIAISTYSKGDSEFEDLVSSDADTWGNSYYQMMDEKSAYYITSEKTSDGEIYYGENLVFDLGDTVKTVVFYAKTEEVQICDSDLYFNVATGYDNKLSDDDIFEPCFYGEYDESYYFPSIYVAKSFEGYDKEKLYFDFLKEWTLTEDQYNKWVTGDCNWTDEDTRAYFEALGYEIVYTTSIENDDFNAYSYCLTTDNSNSSKYDTFTYIEKDGTWYLINTWTQLTDPTPSYLEAMLESIHVK